MVQFARPVADLLTHAEWTATPYWSKVDEGAPGDSVVIQNPSPETTDIIVLDLGSVTDPASSVDHTIRANFQKVAGGGVVRLTVELRQGYVDESTLGTLITTALLDTSNTGFVTPTHALTGTEIDSITDYPDLQFRVWASRDNGGTGRATDIDFLELEVPDAAGGTNEGSVSGSLAWVGTVTGTADRSGSVSGSIGWVGSVTGATEHEGTADGSISWAGSVTGEAPTVGAQQGSVNGSVAWAGSVTGEATHEGSVTGAVGWAGTVTGESPEADIAEGSVNGTVTWAGSVDGQSDYEGSAAGAVVWSGTVTGTADHSGSVAGTIDWAGIVTGAHPAASFWKPNPAGAVPLGVGVTDSDPLYTPFGVGTSDSDPIFTPVKPGDPPPW